MHLKPHEERDMIVSNAAAGADPSGWNTHASGWTTNGGWMHVLGDPVIVSHVTDLPLVMGPLLAGAEASDDERCEVA